MNYNEYLQSDAWKEIKKKSLKRDYYKKCDVCGSENNIHLHHRNYKWVNTDTPMVALIPMCKDCHFEIHRLSKKNNITYKKAVQLLKKNIRIKQSGQMSFNV